MIFYLTSENVTGKREGSESQSSQQWPSLPRNRAFSEERIEKNGDLGDRSRRGGRFVKPIAGKETQSMRERRNKVFARLHSTNRGAIPIMVRSRYRPRKSNA